MPNLPPGVNKEGGTLPNVEPDKEQPPVPPSWQDSFRIIRTVLELYERSPEEARKVHEFARQKLAAIVRPS